MPKLIQTPMSQERPPIFLIPGLGADQRNYPAPWTELPGSTRLAWPEYHGRASMPEVARFMAETWRIPAGAILVGSSFGGVLACEISKFLPVHALVLIASSTDGKDFTATARMKWLTRMLPLRLAQWILRCSGPLQELVWGRAASPVARAVLDSIQMFGTCQATFYRDMFQAIETWEGLEASQTRLVRIHGVLDKLVLRSARADLLLKGGHMIAVTHAQECVALLRQWLESDTPSDEDRSGG